MLVTLDKFSTALKGPVHIFSWMSIVAQTILPGDSAQPASMKYIHVYQISSCKEFLNSPTSSKFHGESLIFNIFLFILQLHYEILF